MGRLAFGTGGRFGRLSDSLAKKLVGFAIDNDIRVFDTGFEYCKGASQSLLFRTLSNHFREFMPEVEISTKFRSTSNPTLLSSWIDSSLSMLVHRDYIDNVFLWGPSIDDLKENVCWEKLAYLRESGKIVRYGVNTHDIEVMEHLLENQNNYGLDCIMIDYNLLQMDRKSVIDRFSRLGVRVWAGTALCQGFLNQSLIEMTARAHSFSYLGRALLNPATRRMRKPAGNLRRYIRENYKIHSKHIPLSFVSSEPNISYIPVGMLSLSSIAQNLKTLQNPAPPEVINDVSSWSFQHCQIDN